MRSVAHLCALLAACGSLLNPAGASAGKLLDYIRSYDLNDYALGVAYSTSQNPYPGSKNSTIVYPYLTSFRHSAFTDNWLLIRDGNVGLRFVVEDDWEFGLVGRVQTLGQNVTGIDELAGLDDRNWALEVGPLVGFRRWPVNMQLRTYWEAPNSHDGTTSELEFSLPREYHFGYLVPAIRLSHQSSDYTDYYFGVSAREATAGRPEYRPGSATNVWAGITVGYELAPQWLLRASVGVEMLDDSITDSPIVDSDQLWNGSVGIAYNADLFNPRDHDYAPERDTLDIRLGTLSGSIDTRVTRNSAGGEPGDEVDLEDLIGAADHRTVLQIDTRLRLGHYHRLQLGYFELDRRSSKILEQDIDYGDQTFTAGTEVETSISSSLLRFAYSYSLLRDNQKELGVSAGLGYFTFDTLLREAGSDQAEPLRAEAPLPTMGAFASAALGSRWQVVADVTAFGLRFDRYDGFMTYLSVGLERRFGNAMSVGLGYDYFSLQLESRDEDLGGEFKLTQHGPKLYLGLSF